MLSFEVCRDHECVTTIQLDYDVARLHVVPQPYYPLTDSRRAYLVSRVVRHADRLRRRYHQIVNWAQPLACYQQAGGYLNLSQDREEPYISSG